MKGGLNMADIEKEERIMRILYMFNKLQVGSGINKKEMAERFNVSDKSIQRDIDSIRAFLTIYLSDENNADISYNKIRKEYLWTDRNNMLLTEKEIAVLSTILLESRSLPASEVQRILKKMYIQCSQEEEKNVEALVKNELFNYVPPQHGKNPADILYELIRAKRSEKITEISYKAVKNKDYHWLKVKPLGIMFDQYYFYLMAKMADDENDDKAPIAYRIDRIAEIKITDKYFSVDHKNRFQEGKFRQEAQFMSTGEKLKVKFRFWGKSLEAILDRMPNAQMIQRNDNDTVLEAEVYGKGAKMWFLSQAEYLEVLEPQSFREEMQATIEKMLKIYK